MSNWQSGYSPGVLGLGAGQYSVDMKGDGFSRGRPGEHPTIPNAPTFGDFLGAITHAGSLGATMATPMGSVPGTALGLGANALGITGNPPANVQGVPELMMGVQTPQPRSGQGFSLGDILGGLDFSGIGGGGYAGGPNLGMNAGPFG